MSRGAGRKAPNRSGSAAPDISDEARYIGQSDKDIPGGREHLINPTVPPPAAPLVPVKRDPHRGILAHGVPPDGQHHERDVQVEPYRPKTAPVGPAPVPVPVYIVQEAGGGRAKKVIITDSITVPPSTTPEPVRLANVDRRRLFVRLLNETPTTGNPVGVRFGKLSTLATSAAALLPPGMTGYLTLETHDELFAISADTNANKVSVILETVDPGA